MAAYRPPEAHQARSPPLAETILTLDHRPSTLHDAARAAAVVESCEVQRRSQDGVFGTGAGGWGAVDDGLGKGEDGVF